MISTGLPNRRNPVRRSVSLLYRGPGIGATGNGAGGGGVTLPGSGGSGGGSTGALGRPRRIPTQKSMREAADRTNEVQSIQVGNASNSVVENISKKLYPAI